MASSSSLLGAAGEHYIMSELLRRGYIAALAPQGVPNTDIVVSDIQGSRLCSIQAKARRDLEATAAGTCSKSMSTSTATDCSIVSWISERP